MWKRSYGGTMEAPPNERGGNRYVLPNATAPHRDSTCPPSCRKRPGSSPRVWPEEASGVAPGASAQRPPPLAWSWTRVRIRHRAESAYLLSNRAGRTPCDELIVAGDWDHGAGATLLPAV